MNPRAASLSASSAESAYGSDGSPVLHSTSVLASNAAFHGHQSAQALLPGQHNAPAELALDYNINKAIQQDLKKSLSPFVHFTIDVGGTGTTPIYMCFIAHWVVDHDGVLHRRQAVMAMCETKQDNVQENALHRLREVRGKWLSPLKLEVGYVTTATISVAYAVEGNCVESMISPVYCFYLLMKGVMERVKKRDFLMVRLLHTLNKISIHFEQSLAAHNRLKELYLLCGLPQELLEEKMPKPSVNLFLSIRFVLARHPAFSAYQKENPEFNLTPWDWRLLHHLAYLLKPCEDTITTIKQTATLGEVLHEFHLLESKVNGYLQQLLEERDLAVASSATNFACELLRSLESHKELEMVRHSILYQTAALLHPFFRDQICKYLKGDAELAKWQLKKRVTWQIEMEYLRNISSHQATPSSMEVASQELESYLQDNIDITLSILDPLVYWYRKKHMWPSLSSLAFRYFSCPASHVVLEEVVRIEDFMISGRFQERLALNTLNRGLIVAEFKASNTTT